MSNNTGIPKIAIFVFILFISGLAFLLGLTVGRADQFFRGNDNADSNGSVNYDVTGKTTSDTVEVNFDRFWEVWDKILADYVDADLDQQKMLDGAIKGMVDSIGDHATLYYNEEETNAYEELSAGNFGRNRSRTGI